MKVDISSTMIEKSIAWLTAAAALNATAGKIFRTWYSSAL